jgi:HPr kinase/phosphorylase
VSELSIVVLIEEAGPALGLTLIAGERGLGRTISAPRIQKPGLALAGYDEQLHEGRLLTLGGTEVEYLRGTTAEKRALGIRTMMAAAPACIVVTRALSAPLELAEACEAQQVPILSSTLVSAEFISRITQLLQEKLSPSTSAHGVLVDVLGVGVLLLGKSGIGKSEAALDLVVRGHRLVADDVVQIRRVGPNQIQGSGSGLIRHHMEIRGLGIINIKDLYGVSAVRDAKEVELVIELSDWDEGVEYDRLGVDDQIWSVLGVELPLLRVPVRPGRSVSTIIEVAARNQLLKDMGHHSAREFAARVGRATRGTAIPPAVPVSEANKPEQGA